MLWRKIPRLRRHAGAIATRDPCRRLPLKAAWLVPAIAKTAKVIKTGELNKAVKLSGVLTTKGARAAIEAAGGSTDAPVPQPKPKPEPKWVAAPQPEAQANEVDASVRDNIEKAKVMTAGLYADMEARKAKPGGV